MIESDYLCHSWDEIMFTSFEDFLEPPSSSLLTDFENWGWCSSPEQLKMLQPTPLDNKVFTFEINDIDNNQELLESPLKTQPSEDYKPLVFDNSGCTEKNFGNIHLNDSSVYDNFFSGMEKLIPDLSISEIDDILQDECAVVTPDVENPASSLQTTSTSVRNSAEKPKKMLKSLSKKSWSKMSREEQLDALFSLSVLVSCYLDFNDQVTVIKIIYPEVTISPSDTEFKLDISCLNDTKLKRIISLFRKRMYPLSNSKKVKCFSKMSQQKTTEHRSKGFSRRTSPKAKKMQKKEKLCTDKDDRQERKLKLHGQKEIQSGLFVYEKVVKLSNPLEDEDVNILE